MAMASQPSSFFMGRVSSSQPVSRKLKTYGRSSTQPSSDAPSAVSTARAVHSYMIGLDRQASEPVSNHDTSSTECGKRSLNDDGHDHDTPPSANKRRKEDTASSFLTQVAMSSPASSIFDVVDATPTRDLDDTALTAFSPADAKEHAPTEQETENDQVEIRVEASATIVSDESSECRAPAGAMPFGPSNTRNGSDFTHRGDASGPNTIIHDDATKLGGASRDAGQPDQSNEDANSEGEDGSENDEIVDEHDAEETTNDGDVFLSQPMTHRDHSPTLTATPSSSPHKGSFYNSSPGAPYEEEPSQSLPLRRASEDRQHPRATDTRDQRGSSPPIRVGQERKSSPPAEPDDHRESSPIVILHLQPEQDDSDAQSASSIADADEEARPRASPDAVDESGSEHADEDDALNSDEDGPSIIQNGPDTMPVPLDNTVDKVEYSIQAIVGHRASKDVSDALDLEVRWVGYDETTWEPERSVQAQVPDAVYKYWRSVEGGRPGDVYRVFAILDHYAKKPSAAAGTKRKHPTVSTRNMVFRVQWEGYSTSDEDTTIESAGKIKRIAPAVVETYWEHVREAGKQ